MNLESIRATIACLEQVIGLETEIQKLQNDQQNLLSDLYVTNYALVDQWLLIASASKVVKLQEWTRPNSPIVFEVLDIIS